MAPKQGQSKGQRKIKEEKVHDVHWQLSKVKPYFAAKLIGAELKMPSVIPPRVMDYLKSTDLGISEFMDPDTKFTLPTANLNSAVRQVVAGFEQLVLSGSYHGGFSFQNTYYVMAKDTGAITVKLCNFIEKGGPYKNKIAEDWSALKDGLVEIRDIAVMLKNVWVGLDCCQLDGLIGALRNIGPGNAESAFEVIKGQPFFWGRSERKDFFIADIPFALKRDDFFSKVRNAAFIELPWDDNWKYLLDQMNKYRSTKDKKAYDINKRTDYVKFISGLYTHEFELKLDVSVDAALQSEDPSLCYRLYALLHVSTLDS